MEDDSSLLPEALLPGLDQPPPPAAGGERGCGTAYRVLARKYRPQSFAELIGQEAMVRTLGNAIARDRLAHAFLLTGVRGVGKTSTARLIAKAVNCVGADGRGGPTIDPCGMCDPCRSITEGRNIDVIEMDAASHTGVDDVREIIEAVRYAAVGARFKIYIIDEVHMLSKSAFNALLKTLEEPPPHVKFIFATTEVGKVPVTVLSRCQRFDLRRIPADRLAEHFAAVAKAEGVAVEPAAMAVIARAAEGSARDGLSMLDQAIAHGEGRVEAAAVRDMLGLADRGRIRGLLAALLDGDSSAALAGLDEAHLLGVDPASLIRGLLETVHSITRAKAGSGSDVLNSAEEREASAGWATRLSWGTLHCLWQMLLKGLGDVQVAPDPQEAATMVALRIIHSAELPDPGALIARLARSSEPERDGGSGRPLAPSPASPPPAAAAPSGPADTELPPSVRQPESFRQFVDLIETSGRLRVAVQLRDQVRLIRFAPGELVLRPLRPLGADFVRELAAAARDATGGAWAIRLAEDGGEPTLAEEERIAEEQLRAAVLRAPQVAALIEAFPDAILESISATKGA